MNMGAQRENGTYKNTLKILYFRFYNILCISFTVQLQQYCALSTPTMYVSVTVFMLWMTPPIFAKLMLYNDKGFYEVKNNDCGIAHSLSTLWMKIYNILGVQLFPATTNLQSVTWKHNSRLVITKGYGVRVRTIEGQNAFAATLCFV